MLEIAVFLRLLWMVVLRLARGLKGMGGARVGIFVLVVRELSLVSHVKVFDSDSPRPQTS
jgi:hypothetical protein